MKLHTVVMKPGPYNRGGARHEGHKVHELEAFTAAQLREMHQDPHLALIVGGDALTEEQIAAAEAAEKAKAEKSLKAKG